MASLTATPLGTELIGAEIIPREPPQGGAAPWERQGASHRGPDDPESRAKAEKWQKRAAAEEDENGEDDGHVDRRRRRAAERKAKKEEAEAAQVKTLETNARRMYWLGFFALPLLWLVSVLYFHTDYKSADPNPVIRKCALPFCSVALCLAFGACELFADFVRVCCPFFAFMCH